MGSHWTAGYGAGEADAGGVAGIPGDGPSRLDQLNAIDLDQSEAVRQQYYSQ